MSTHVFPEALRHFDSWMVVKGWSEATRHTYRYQLTLLWCDYLVLYGLELVTATEDDLAAYLRSIPAQGSKRGDAMRAIKAFYGYAVGRIRPDNPTRDMHIPRPKLTPAPELDLALQRRLLIAAFRQEPRRGWAIMLALETGARVSTLVAIRREDFHLARSGEESVWFRVAKGDRPYGVPLERAGLAAARGLLMTGYDPVLGVGAARFRQWVHEAEETAGLERVWPHLLRHTFAKRLAEGGDVEAWRQGMNHADLSQWPRYVGRRGDQRVRDALRAPARA